MYPNLIFKDKGPRSHKDTKKTVFKIFLCALVSWRRNFVAVKCAGTTKRNNAKAVAGFGLRGNEGINPFFTRIAHLETRNAVITPFF
jgi:hypothetical protein